MSLSKEQEQISDLTNLIQTLSQTQKDQMERQQMQFEQFNSVFGAMSQLKQDVDFLKNGQQMIEDKLE